MREYECRMLKYVDQLDHYLEKAVFQARPVNVSDVFFWFCWDVMGETTFGKSFNMLEDERWHDAIVMLKRALSILGPMSPAPWAFHIAFKYLKGRWVVRDWQMMKQTCYSIVDERIKVRHPAPTI